MRICDFCQRQWRALIDFRIIRALMLLLVASFALYAANQAVAASLESPDGRVRLNVEIVENGKQSQLAYEVEFEGQGVLASSTISFVRDDGVVIGDRLSLNSIEGPVSHYDTWEPVYGERSTIEDSYNQIAVNTYDSSADCPMRVVFRCYDSGVAFRSILGSKASDAKLTIRKEQSAFRFYDDHTAWYTYAAQGVYRTKRISKIGSGVERPLVLRINDNTYAAILEAKLVDYPRMKLGTSKREPFCLVSSLGGSAQSRMPLKTPWRVVMVGNSPGELLENNYIVLNLNDPCEIADTSWIKPGKVIRDITLTNEGALACIEFAAKHNLQFVEFDAGWYGPEDDDGSDATTVTLDEARSNGPLDLHGLIERANERGIGIILYVNRRALETQLDDILPLYQSWGVSGVKYGFVNVGSQYWTSWLHDAIRKAAKYELMVDVHDEYRPTGFTRTYPNLMTTEGVRGDEASPSASQVVTGLFTRSLTGAADRTVCYFDQRVGRLWSRPHQLAKAVCCYSPWQFLYWYDTPLPQGRNGDGGGAIQNVPELKFFSKLPTTWDDTKVISGEIGKHAIIARRAGSEWFVGAMNGGEQKEISLPLSFLEDEREYVAYIYADDLSADQATRVEISRLSVNSETTLPVAMRQNGGQAIRITPAKELDASVSNAETPITVEAHATSVDTATP